MHKSILALSLSALLSTTAQAAYVLADNYNSTNFFQSFDFFSDPDPTNGFTNYLTAPKANSNSLAGYITPENRLPSSKIAKTIILATDASTTKPPNPGRDSTRVHSKKAYTHGLFIADIKHMPGGECGVWPAFWTVGANWPYNGEIDIFENVNLEPQNRVTLHTGPGCVMRPSGSVASSKLLENDCNTDQGRTGCGFQTNSEANFGTGFNNAGGGVYAMEWTSKVIRVWHWSRANIPSDVLNLAAAPNPETWGTPMAAFAGEGCDIDTHFKEHKIVFNTAFCGDWAGNPDVWKNSKCGALAKTCQEYVTNSPASFDNAYWLLNSVRVYQDAGKKVRRARGRWSVSRR